MSEAPREALPFSWDNWREFSRSLPGDRGAAAGLAQSAFRAGLGALSALGWRRDIPAPLPADTVVIVGHQRSGTTWLHRMLAAHPAASAMPLHALLLPADFWQRRLARPRPAWLDHAQDRLFGALDPLHRIRFHEPEEDEFLLWGVFRSPMNGLDRPWPEGLIPDIDGDERALQFYAQAVARAVRRSGRRHVGKNPHFTHRIDALRQVLPGVRVVQLVRAPHEAIPSRMSLIRAIWRRRFPGFSTLAPHHVAHIYASSVRCYLGGLGRADLDVGYPELCADPVGVVRAIHRALELEEVDQVTAGRLAATARAGRTPHRYSLAEFGLDEPRLRADLAPVYARWRF